MPYSVKTYLKNMKELRKEQIRLFLGGKLIEKKRPQILLMHSQKLIIKIQMLFAGSGNLEKFLKKKSKN